MAVEIAIENIMPLVASHLFAFLLGACMIALLEAVKDGDDR